MDVSDFSHCHPVLLLKHKVGFRPRNDLSEVAGAGAARTSQTGAPSPLFLCRRLAKLAGT